MASWKKYFSLERDNYAKNIAKASSEDFESLFVSTPISKYSSFLPEVYAGQPQRIERYNTYELMDLDPIINLSLDIIAESCVQKNNNGYVFSLKINNDLSDIEKEILYEYLKKWIKINEFDVRLFRIFRNVLKYGDQFFIRDPNTFKLLWVDPSKVKSIIVNQAKGKIPEYYVVSDLDVNLKTLVATQPPPAHLATTGVVAASPGPLTYSFPRYIQTQKETSGNETYVASDFIVHFTLSEGLDNNWPFGNSILENIFKVYKQKELLEDSIIIYRVQRAPERKVFYIDTGSMPPHKAHKFLERIKNEIQQRRIPNRKGGGSSILDASYNPLSMLEDYFFAVSPSENRGSRVERLEGGKLLGEIDDLLYFENKMRKGLRIPSSYLYFTTEEGDKPFYDGRVGTALIQEYRFFQYCKRLQHILESSFNEEFKRYLKHNNINIDFEEFDLMFNEPLNFAKYRQIEIDKEMANVFNSLTQVDYLSKRFLLKRFLGLTDEEITENEKMWLQENSYKFEEEYDELTSKTQENILNSDLIDDELKANKNEQDKNAEENLDNKILNNFDAIQKNVPSSVKSNVEEFSELEKDDVDQKQNLSDTENLKPKMSPFEEE